MKPFGTDPVEPWIPSIAYDVPSAWRPASGHLEEAFVRAGFDTVPHHGGADATPLCVEGRVQGTPVRAALLTTANRRLARFTDEQIVTDLERSVPDPRVITAIDLPIGTSLRMRTRIRVAPDAPEQAVVQYVTPVLGESRVVLTLLTGDLAYEQEFVDTVDRIAVSMVPA